MVLKDMGSCVSSTPTLFSLYGAKKTRLTPSLLVTAAPAPRYLPSPRTPAARVLMVRKVSVTASSTPTLFWLHGVKYTWVPNAIAPSYFDVPIKGVLIVVKVVVTVSSTPTLSWKWGAKKTLVPTAAVPP